jgi:type IV pilus assembly protein PilC
MIRGGEETGGLSKVLHMSASWLEADHRVYSKLKSALTYPAFVLVAACLMTLGLFIWVVPGLLEVLVQTNAKLPPLTLMVMAVTRVATNPMSYFFPLGLIGLVATNWRSFVGNREAMARVWEVVMPMPMLGPSLRAATMSRYCFAAYTLLETGSPPTRAVDLAAEASGSALLAQDKERVLQTLFDGGQISEAFALRPDIYDPRVVQFVQAGEASASVPDMMDRAASILALELDASLERLSSTLEPILLLGIGAIVGIILVSVFLPLYGSLQNI